MTDTADTAGRRRRGRRADMVAATDRATARAAASPRIETLLAAIIYAGYAVVLTWPLITNPGGLLSGTGISGDLGGSVSQVTYIASHHIFPFAPAVLHGLNAPQGLNQAWVENWASFPSNVLLFGLGYIFGGVVGSNAFLWLSYLMSGLSMFWLTRHLFGNFMAALLAGFAFAFFPWAVDKLNGHYQYMDGWALVLGVWRMIELAQRPTLRNALLAGAAAAFGMWWTPYFILIGGVGFVAMELVVLVVGVAQHRLLPALRATIVAGLPIVGLFAALGVLAALAGGVQTGAIRAQSIGELYTYSARVAEWFVPDRNNLFFTTGPYLTAHLHGSNFSEETLYLGVSVVLLAIAGSLLAAAGIQRHRRAGAADVRIVASLSGALLALVAAWFSTPPKVHLLGVWVPMPSDVIFQITSTWRVYTRFVELIELGLCIPMAGTVAWGLRRLGPRTAIAAFAVLAAIVVLDLWARPPVRTISVAPPPQYVWLRDHPGGIVADYPIEPAVFPDYHALYWQAYDGHPLLQGYAANTETESMKLELGDLTEPKTASYLAALGVKYIVVTPGQPGATLQTVSRDHYVVRFASAAGSVWQVGAAPARTRVDGLDGFSVVEGNPGQEYRWMSGPGTLGVYARDCSACTGEVDFESGSNDSARVLTVREQGSSGILARISVPPGRVIPVHVLGVKLINGQARLLLTTNLPPNVPISGGDPRSLSVNVLEPRLRLTP